MFRYDFQPSADCETNHWDERVLESDAIDVVVPGAKDEITSPVVAVEEPIENIRIDLRTGPDLPRGADPFRFGRRFDEVVNEPAAKPARRDFLNHGGLTTFQRTRHRSQVHFVGDTQVFEALSDAPFAWSRCPVKLAWRERLRERGRAVVGGVELPK